VHPCKREERLVRAIDALEDRDGVSLEQSVDEHAAHGLPARNAIVVAAREADTRAGIGTPSAPGVAA
jgi:hypothetical protein